MLKNEYIVCFVIMLLLFLPACGIQQDIDTTQVSSFTTESTYSYDGKYLAEQPVEYDESTPTYVCG